MQIALAPLRALLVALLGALLAWLWFQGERLAPALVAATLVLAAIVSQVVGARSLPAHPVRARWLLEAFVLAQVVLATVAAAVVIVVAVGLAAPTGATEETKELLSAVATGITTFVTAMLVGDDDADAALGERIMSSFQSHYERDQNEREVGIYYLKAESQAERWVFSDSYGGVTGWGWRARGKRVSELAKRLKTDDVVARC